MSIAATDVAGLATKNDESDLAAPASVPPAHEGPDELVRTAGTSTSYVPLASVSRNGCSSVTGLVASTVFCEPCPLNEAAGAPSTPEYTMFHSAPLTPPMELLRVRYCWLP
jgi:hypothetical protein